MESRTEQVISRSSTRLYRGWPKLGPFCPYRRTRDMSFVSSGQKLSSSSVGGKSAHPSTPDMPRLQRHVGFVPNRRHRTLGLFEETASSGSLTLTVFAIEKLRNGNDKLHWRERLCQHDAIWDALGSTLDIPLAVVVVAISIAVIRRKSALLRFRCPSTSGI
jgi:hypothetical protein